MSTRQDIREWFERGVAQGASHLIVVVDTFDHENYPVYVMPTEDVRRRESEYNMANMQRVMEVYSLSQDMEKQLAEHRSFNY